LYFDDQKQRKNKKTFQHSEVARVNMQSYSLFINIKFSNNIKFSVFLSNPMLFAIILIILIIQIQPQIEKTLHNGAFCLNSTHYQNYPTNVSEQHIPWVWDAIYDPLRKLVEVTVVSRRSCEFDKKTWLKFITLYPMFKNQLGDGLQSNILIDSIDKNIFDFIGTKNSQQGIMGKRVLCVYYDDDGNIIDKRFSLIIRGKANWISISTLLIKCPAPLVTTRPWDKMKLSLPYMKYLQELLINKNVNNSFNNTTIFHNSTVIKITRNDTQQFRVCKIPSYSLNNKKYGLSICTASMGSSRENIVEWIEYHLLHGVDHFFIYYTAIPYSKQSQLRDVLFDYIEENIVTLIPWPYLNCVKNMHSGRCIVWFFFLYLYTLFCLFFFYYYYTNFLTIFIF
jgi:hypothetical protein